MIGGEEHRAWPDHPLIFGRADAGGMVGLDPNDMGISAVACSVEAAWGVSWVIDQSTKRPLLLEHPGGPAQVRLGPGHRYAITTDQLTVLVPGAIYTHVLEVVVPESYALGLRPGSGRLTTGTITGAHVALSERERDAVVAVCAGYLESFPHRREHPVTYAEAARALGQAWTSVRKAVERVSARFANKQDLYFDGAQANYDLAAHLISTGVLTGADLSRLAGRQP